MSGKCGLRDKGREAYLGSYKNLLFLNEYYKHTKSSEYKKVLNEPGRFKNNRFFVGVSIGILLIFYPLLIVWQYIIAVKKTGKYGQNSYCGESNSYYLSFLNKSLRSLINKARIEEHDSIWLVNEETDFKDVENKCFYYCLLDRNDLHKALVDAIYVTYKGVIRYGYSVSFLGLEALDWFICYYACLHLPLNAKLFFCNHMDQHACLINALPHNSKILIQHGTLLIRHNAYGLGETYLLKLKGNPYWTYNVPCKYKNVVKVYSFSLYEYEALCHSIFLNRPDPIIVGYGLQTYAIDNELPTVLIIGYYLKYGDNEMKMIKAIYNYNINLIIKNHPSFYNTTSFYENLQKKYNFQLLNENKFPNADVVISYDSTLAFEYESIGAKVLFYDDNTIDGIISETIQIINQRSAQCNIKG